LSRHTWRLISGDFIILIIPSTLQYGRDGTGFVLENKTSTRPRSPRFAANWIGISPSYNIKTNLEM
jgi:hypothetical protein